MPRSRSPLSVSFLLLAFSALACSGDSLTAPGTGTLQITTSTTGAEPDVDGYTVQVDAEAAQAIGTAASIQRTDVSTGDHTVQLAGIAPNCTVSGDNPRTVSVTSGQTMTVSFAVTCGATTGGLQVTATTTGDSPDADGYTVIVDGTEHGTLGATGAVSIGGLAPGDHAVGVGGVAANCQVQGDNPRTSAISAGASTTVAFAVTCTAPPANVGTLRIVTATSGADQDPDGYAFAVDGGATQPIGVNAAATLANVAGGNHSVQFSGLAPNCILEGANPRFVSVATGTTADVSFLITCGATTGTIQVNVTSSGSPADPDGYTVELDDIAPGQSIATTGSAAFPGVAAGNHTMALTGVAKNCSVASGVSRNVAVMIGATATVEYQVSCSSRITWTPMASGTTSGLTGVWGTSATNVFAVDGQGVIYRFDGASWSEAYRANFQLDDIWAGSPAGVFAVGRFNFPSAVDDIVHYDGANWTTARAQNLDTDEAFASIWGSSATDVFAVGTTFDYGLIMHYDGSAWSKSYGGGYGWYTDVSGTSSTNVYAVGTSYIPDGDPGSTRGTVLHFDGSQWSQVYSEPGLNPAGVWASSASDVHVVGTGGTILHFDGQQWSHTPSPTTHNLYDVWGTSATDVYAVGDGGVILHFDGSGWGEVRPTTQILLNIWGSSPSDLFAVGAGGTILHGTR